MKTGPLTESELEWLDETIAKYASDASIIDVSELDGMLTAILSSPLEIEPAEWMFAVWAGQTMCRTGRPTASVTVL